MWSPPRRSYVRATESRLRLGSQSRLRLAFARNLRLLQPAVQVNKLQPQRQYACEPQVCSPDPPPSTLNRVRFLPTQRPREEDCGSGSSGASSGATSPSISPSSPTPLKTVQPPPTPGLVLPKPTQQTPQVEANETFQYNGMTYQEQASTANDARTFTFSGIAASVRHAIMVRKQCGRMCSDGV